MLPKIEDCIPALRRYALALLRDRQDADDLVHDCLVRALDRLHAHHDDGNIRAWLFTILHNLFVSQRRRARARPDTERLEESEAADAYTVPPDQEAKVQQKEILDVLNNLPEDQRTIILLVAVEDLSYAETAKVLGIPIGTVMSRLARGRERLRHVTQERERPLLRRVK